ncbi:1-phosphatidylinositol 4,5-bisphosphate phosphodiesterase beta-2 [Brienomyrus brachyistius]|uniref:1-phosphatidylinositol 4,5-bisphosphate phosphodiesterase beta-2 n=1 Tax=Brienomyrus brachyistius TaxID=42636 RepID=UPI0020B3CA71|nr:1-phosphatidylinositol 4,5-bisphosphate phosphodiesterase beta-2 [Brienomyrus brachyistius]
MEKKPRGLEPPDVKDYLIKGDRFIKWTEESTRTSPVTMKMDPKGYYLYWTNQNRETVFLDVATIRDTRCGKYAKMPKHPKVRNVFNMDFPDSHHLAKMLTIVSGMDMVNLTYHNFFAHKEKVVEHWAEDILAIAYNTLRNNACKHVFLEKVFIRISLQTNKDGKIPVKNIYKMFPADKKRVESALAAANLPKGKGDTMKPDVFTESAFKAFLTHLCPRPEIYEIFTTYSTKPYMTKETLLKFLNEKQRDSRLNEELFPPLRLEQVKTIIEKYEPCSSTANRGNISPEGLLYYLIGPDLSVVALDKLARYQDMMQPVPHYFVKSSHNTYLTAGQFSGISSPEMYRQCLLAGCRCLELDCWKGKPVDEEPIITHGFTMTTEILFKDVIEAIHESAFKTSQYPVILSFENHVDSVKQQDKMANYLRTIFGDSLLVDPLEKYPLEPGHQIPSPAELMGKILIKNKKNNSDKQSQGAAKKTTGPDQHHGMSGPHESQDGEVLDDHEEHDDHDEQDEEKMKNSDEGTAGQEVTAYEAMSSLVNYIQPNKFISFENARKKNRSYAISSFVETKGSDLISKSAVEFVEYNKRQMSRIYPKGTRMDSSNYNPQPFWNAGCQMVALNYQTMDFPMQLNMALFEFNGRTGYLLKHELLRGGDKTFDPHTDRLDTIVASTLTVKVYSGQFLSDKNVKTGVEAEIVGLPNDPKRKFRTKWSSTANAINPVWNEEPFVFEKILLPEMASLRLVVHDESGKFLGHRIIPIYALQSGYQHICLRSESNVPLTLPSLFVYIEVKDYIPAAFADFSDALFNPTKSSDKPTKSSEYTCPYEMPFQPLPGATEEKMELPSAQTDSGAETERSTPPPEDTGLQNGVVTSDTSEDNIKILALALHQKRVVFHLWILLQLEAMQLNLHPQMNLKKVPLSQLMPYSQIKRSLLQQTQISELSTVSIEELTQHKSFVKVTKRQEKEIKELEKKNEKKGEELIQKYRDMFKSIKKKNSVKKKEADKVDLGDKVTELKAKLHADLKGLREDQYELVKKKKEQHTTEQLAKLLEIAKERHTSEAKSLRECREREVKDKKKKLTSSGKSGSGKGRTQKGDDGGQSEEQTNQGLSDGYAAQQELLEKKQAATVEQIKEQTNQLNQQALEEYHNKIRTLPNDLRDAVNACVGEHFPEQVDQGSAVQTEGGPYGSIFLG